MRNFILFIIIISASFLWSCTDQAGGLFYSLEQETAISNGTLEKDITIGSMEKSGNYYLIATGEFQYRKVDADNDTEWSICEPAGEYKDYLCYNMILTDGYTFASFFSTDGSDYILVKADTSSIDSGLKWSSPLTVSDTAGTDEKVIDFTKAGSLLFLSTVDSSSRYSIYSGPINGFSETTPLEIIASDLTVGGELKADYDGSEYWIIFGNRLYSGDGTQSGTSNVTADVYSESESAYLKGDGFTGILCTDADPAAGTEVYLTSEEGVLLVRKNGAWEILENTYDDDGLFESLYGIKRFTVGTDIDIILAASESGYYEMDADNTIENKSFISPKLAASDLTNYIQYSSIELSDSIILDFFVDEATDSEKVFALGYNSGLWKNSLQGTARFWDSECKE